MADFRSSVIIHKPLSEVFHYMASMENVSEMMPNVVKMEKLTEGPIGKGTKLKETRSVRGKTVNADIEFVEYKQDQTFITRSNSNGLITEYVYNFHEIEEGTQVEFDAFVKTSGLVMKLTKRFIVDMIKKEDGFQLEYLKEMLEGKKEE
ncbi:SRPBCC family protein [Bacillus sp. S/N-304-OC-R1]|uniref:SRPBCC family protein n=1 Tax=Bacillus sp. S/N-304-OC-R1 TaxID=2758034 RepID=UPI001C8E7E93|nr:SRPBCC family protein [Bacillus sp. S/N-304-OC-R1]MBY0123391.1 SRPBCC family protein [Bacillus sp. S/N-304-OC-R1]